MPTLSGYGEGAYGEGAYGGVLAAFTIVLEAGDEYGTQLLDDSYSINVRRGLRNNGVTDDLEPAAFTAVVKGSDAVNPVTNPDIRPGRPVRIRGTVDFGATWRSLFTGRIQRAHVQYDKEDAQDPNAYQLTITGTDLVSELARFPSEVAVAGSVAQRVAAVLDPTGLPYAVEDASADAPAAALPTDAKDVLGQLRLIRDTTHALMYVNRDGVLVTIADSSRTRAATAPDWVATDQGEVDGIHYTEITPAFDTDAVVNVLTLKLLDGADDPETVWTDEDSRAAWGDKAQAVTVNDGLPETHADLWLASRVEPDLLPERVTFIVQDRTPITRAPEGPEAHRTAGLEVELYDVVQVVREGVPTADTLVREIAHNITPRRWSVDLGLRVPEALATRWVDVPAGLTWADVPADMTWKDAVHWRPYL